MSESQVEVAIIGGGIAGLTAAYRFANEGVRFRLFEAAPRLGGLIRTERQQGFLIDAGPDTLLSHRPEALALCRELGLGDRLIAATPAARPTSVVHRRHMYALPEGMSLGVPARLAPLVRTPLFSALGKMRMALDLAIAPRRDGADESIAAFFRRRLGQEALERIGEPLLAGIHAGDAERLSVRANFPMLLDMEARHGSIIRAAWAASRAGAASRGQAFFSLTGGLGELVDTLATRLPPASVRTGVRITSVRARGAGFELDGSGSRVQADALVLAAPLWETARLLVPAAPDAAVALEPIRFASSATVFLGFRREQVARPLEGHGFVVPRREGLRMRACTIASNKYPGRAPDGFVLLKGYLGGLSRTDTLEATDEDIARLFEHEAGPLLGLCGRPVLSRVFRWPGATPQMEVGHAARVAAVQQALSRHPGLAVIGAGLRGSGVSSSVADGDRAASQILARLAHPAEATAH
jgi:oxygen-dependent protoporphyrinogen oxidase